MLKINELAKELFGEMRNLTEDEQDSLYKGLDEISEDTEITLFNIKPRKIVRFKGKVTKVSRQNNRLD